MKIGIIGLSTVGNAIYESFETLGHHVSYFDIKYKNSVIENILDTEIVFLCVPTNMNKNDGSCDTSIVENVVDI